MESDRHCLLVGIGFAFEDLLACCVGQVFDAGGVAVFQDSDFAQAVGGAALTIN